jgi:hypothetical protein
MISYFHLIANAYFISMATNQVGLIAKENIEQEDQGGQ